jgi:hypothetical protein
MQKEWKIATIGIVAVVIFMVAGWSLSNVPHAWLELAGFVLLFFVTGGPIAYGIISLRHHHHRVTEHHISQYGTVLSQHGKFHQFNPVHPNSGGMNVYHHQASVYPQQKELPDPDPDEDVPPDIQVTEEFSPQRLLTSMTSQQQHDLINHLANTGVLSRVKDQDETTPKNVTYINPIEQKACELYKAGKGRVVIARELNIPEEKARGLIEKFTREKVEREVV